MYTVSSNLTAKLADFGLARQISEEGILQLSKHEKLPVRWMAPEVLFYKKFEVKSDVWYVRCG